MSDEVKEKEAPVTERSEADYLGELTEAVVKEASDKVIEKAVSVLTKRVKAPIVAKEEDGSFGEWMTLVGKAGAKNPKLAEESYNVLVNKYGQDEIEKKAMTQGTNTAGGYTVPNVYDNELISLEGYPSVALTKVDTFQIPAQGTHYFPVLDQTATPSTGDNPFLAGVTVGEVNEGAAPGATTQPAFKQLALTPQKYLAQMDISFELLQNNNINIGDKIVELGRELLLSRLEYGIFNSDNTNMTGYIGHASTVNVYRKTVNQINWQDIYKMRSLLLPSAMDPVWVVHPVAYQQLFNLQDSSNRLLWVPNVNSFSSVAGAPQLTLLGIPIAVSQFSPTLGQTGDITLVDFRKHFALGINRQVTVQTSEHFQFNKQLMTYLFSVRAGGKPKFTAPVTLMDGTTKVGAAVQLNAALS